VKKKNDDDDDDDDDDDEDDMMMVMMVMLGVVPPGRASGISLTGNTASFRAALWTNLDKLADNVYVVYSQVTHTLALFFVYYYF